MLPHGPVAARISRSPGQLGVVGWRFESCLGSQDIPLFPWVTRETGKPRCGFELYLPGQSSIACGTNVMVDNAVRARDQLRVASKFAGWCRLREACRNRKAACVVATVHHFGLLIANRVPSLCTGPIWSRSLLQDTTTKLGFKRYFTPTRRSFRLGRSNRDMAIWSRCAANCRCFSAAVGQVPWTICSLPETASWCLWKPNCGGIRRRGEKLSHRCWNMRPLFFG